MVNKEVMGVLDEALKGNFPPTHAPTFFAQWDWWERMGRAETYLGYPMLVNCPQDGKWHTVTEIKVKGW